MKVRRYRLLSRAEVLSLLKELRLELRANGPDELRGHCPEPGHKKKPGPGSFQIRIDGPKAGLHTCYSCGFGGGPVSLIRAVLGLNTKQSIEWLDQFVSGDGIPGSVSIAPFRRKMSAMQQDELLLPNDSLPLFGNVIESEVKPAYDYLVGRGVTDTEIRRHQMHAVPPTSRSYGGRIIVPVIVDGAMVDFVARLYIQAPPSVPKALSGRRDLGAKKEFSLFGYDHIDPSVDTVHIVEGVWGALSLLRSGIVNVVASCGSSWSIERTELLAPWENIILIPDGDDAGSKLVQRASSLRFNHTVRFVKLDQGQQPDTVPSKDIRDLIESAPIAQFQSKRKVILTEWAGKS